MNSEKSLQKLRAILTEYGLDAAVIIPSPNFLYLTGANLRLMERPTILIVPQAGKPAMLIPQLDVNAFTSTGFEAEIFAWSDAEGFQGKLAEVLQFCQLAGKKLGVEGIKLRFFEGEAIRRLEPTLQLVEADDILGRLRLHKSPEEIAKLREAIRISEAALAATLEEVRIGMTELQIAEILDKKMSALGGQGLSFETLVLAGENSARPHGHARPDYQIQSGDALLFDFGAVYEGYMADITRTFFVGHVSEAQARLYEAVKQANEVGRKMGKIGIKASEIDAATRKVLEESGFGHLIAHRTGHGLGIDVHEAPNITLGNDQLLEAGMVFTIEPGLYEAGLLGVRIEDNVVVTEQGLESLTSFPRELQIIAG